MVEPIIQQNGFFPFIVTTNYTEVVMACDYAIYTRTICLITGDNGVGKSWSIVEYIRQSERLKTNGRYPYLYINLSQSEKTDRAIFNMIVQTIRQDDKRYGSASDAKAAAFDLWQRYGFRALFVDDVVELYKSGIEAIRTFHDRGPMHPRIPIILTTIPSIAENLQASQYKAFFSRVGKLYHFNRLERDEIGLLLMQIPPSSPLKFRVDQPDATAIIDALYKGAGGATATKASFRDLDHLLKECDILVRTAMHQRRHDPDLPEPRFDVALIHHAIRSVGKV